MDAPPLPYEKDIGALQKGFKKQATHCYFFNFSKFKPRG